MPKRSQKPGRRRKRQTPAPPSPAELFAGLPLAVRHRLVREIVATRQGELRRAYPGVVGVCAGNRTRRDALGVPRVVEADPALVFVVEHKRPPEGLGQNEALPTHLWAIERIRRRRCLVQVPVDVEELARLTGAVPAAGPGQVVVFAPGRTDADVGQICCVVAPPNRAPRFAVSCRHVFSPDETPGQVFATSRVCLAAEPAPATELALSIDRRGALVAAGSDGAVSLDVQLATIEDGSRLQAALGEVTLNGPVDDPDALPDELFVQTARGPVPVRRDKTVTGELTAIPYGHFGRVLHESLLVVEMAEATPVVRGDSGAPLTTARDGGALAGMVVAVNTDERRAFAIPSSHVLDPQRYSGALPSEKRWRLVPPIELPAAFPLIVAKVVTASLPPSGPLAWGAKVSPAFRDRVRDISTGLGVDPSWLMAVMAFETGRTFSPSKKASNSSATGLIQFTEKTAQGLGTSTAALAQMTAERQLDFVDAYLRPFRQRIGSIEDLYMSVLWPVAVAWPTSAAIFVKGDAKSGLAYQSNDGLDADKDGRVLKSEAAAKVLKALAEGQQPANLA